MCASRRLVRVANATLLVLLMAGVVALASGAADRVRLVRASGGCDRTRLAPVSSRVQSALLAVTSVSPREAWAVGWQGAAENVPLLEHFDGQAWRDVTDQLPVKRGNLYGVTAVSARDVWVLGANGGVPSKPFVLRWDGSSWRRLALPRVVYGASALAATRTGVVWVVAGDRNGFVLPLRWSQQHWHVEWQGLRRQYLGHPGHLSDSANAIVAVSSGDVWMVGTSEDNDGLNHTYAAHWNGQRWTITSTPDPSGHITTLKGGDELLGVAASGPSDVWATGAGSKASFLLRWNGHRWRINRVPREFQAISALLPTRAWAVSSGDDAARWDGTRWSYLPGTQLSGALEAVAAVDSRQAWAVGASLRGVSLKHFALIERLHCTSP